ncbi:MAG: hypothetical protein KDA05_08840 [Phycisphaerales bacterium]|nr:hypothetical protein [Phycisphaerales bacterium]MCB9840303.1 hypothetical protein [Phycisphaeraceae bacterium]
MTTKLTLTAGTAGALLIASSAIAGPIAVDFRGTGLGQSARVSFASGDSAAFSERNLFVGQLRHRLGTGASAKDFLTYCIDLTQYAGDGTFNLVALHDAPVTSPAPSNKWELNHGQIDALNSLYNAYGEAVDSNAKASAFQAAVWEIVFDWSTVDGGTFTAANETNLRTGVVSISNKISNALFTDYLNAAVDGADTTGRLAAIVSATRQDQIIVLPLPGAGALAGAGMLVLGARRRRSM